MESEEGEELRCLEKEKKAMFLAGHIRQFQGDDFRYERITQPTHSGRFKGKFRRQVQLRARKRGSELRLRIHSEISLKGHEIAVSFL